MVACLWLAGSLVLFYLAWLYPHGLGLIFLLLLALFGIGLDFVRDFKLNCVVFGSALWKYGIWRYCGYSVQRWDACCLS